MTKYVLNDIKNITVDLNKPKLVFIKGDLWSWKTTLSKHILNNILKIKDNITSPTYTYYNKYQNNFHFDLYRLKDYDEFFAIGWEDILDNNYWIILVEWPDVIEKYYIPDIIINISRTYKEGEREIKIIENKKI